MSFDMFLLAVESRDLSQADKGKRFRSSIAGDCSLSWFDPVFIQVLLTSLS